MATFAGQIHSGNGYVSHTVKVSGVLTQAAARRLMEARNPGAKISAIRQVSSKDE